MKKSTLIVIMALVATSMFAQVSNKNASYDAATKTLTLTGGKFSNCFVLPIHGNLETYKTLVLETTNPISYRVQVSYKDVDGTEKRKDFYQTAKNGKSVKKIDLSDPELITSLKEIPAVVIQSADNGGSTIIDSIYLVAVKKNKRKEIELK